MGVHGVNNTRNSWHVATSASFPDKIAGRNIIFMIDNKAVLYGWYKELVKNDKSASEVLKAVYV